MPRLKITIGSNEMTNNLKINRNFDRSISSSSEPSNTIRIKPTVPNIGRIGFKSGTSMLSEVEKKLTPKPNASNKITDGIFNFDVVISNR